jgi:hypothetical protein
VRTFGAEKKKHQRKSLFLLAASMFMYLYLNKNQFGSIALKWTPSGSPILTSGQESLRQKWGREKSSYAFYIWRVVKERDL